jgi:hypothetical protein
MPMLTSGCKFSVTSASGTGSSETRTPATLAEMPCTVPLTVPVFP